MTLYAGHGNPHMRVLRNENEKLRAEIEQITVERDELFASNGWCAAEIARREAKIEWLQQEVGRLTAALQQAAAAVELVRARIADEAGVDMTNEQIAMVLNKATEQARAALAREEGMSHQRDSYLGTPQAKQYQHTIMELRAEVERQQVATARVIERLKLAEAEIGRLKVALREIADYGDCIRGPFCQDIARAALEGK